MLCFVNCYVFPAAGVPSLVFSNGRDLLIGDIHGNSLRTLVHSQNRGVAVGVDFHYNLHTIFWTDTIQNKVFFYPLSISSVIFSYPSSVVLGMAVLACFLVGRSTVLVQSEISQHPLDDLP